MQPVKLALDPRYFQIIFQVLFLSYGLIYLNWNAEYLHYLVCVLGCLFFNYLFECIRQKKWLPLTGSKGIHSWGLSVLISAASLCLLLKTNDLYVSALAAFLTVASKYVFRYQKKHIFNPSAFGIIATIFLTDKARSEEHTSELQSPC